MVKICDRLRILGDRNLTFRYGTIGRIKHSIIKLCLTLIIGILTQVASYNLRLDVNQIFFSWLN